MVGFCCGKPKSIYTPHSAKLGQPILVSKGRSVADLHQRAIKRRCLVSTDTPAIYNIADDSDLEQQDHLMCPSVELVTTSSTSSRAQDGNAGRQSVHPGHLTEAAHSVSPLCTSSDPNRGRACTETDAVISDGKRNAEQANFGDTNVAKAKPKAKSCVHMHDRRTVKPPKRRLMGPYGSDPDARAVQQKRSRLDPIAALNRIRTAPLDPYIGPNTPTQHPNTVVEPDD